MSRISIATSILVLSALLALIGARQADAEAPAIRTAEELLLALEEADQNIRTLQAGIQYDRRFALQGDRHVRRGTLFFVAERVEGRARPIRAFEIDFHQLILMPERREESDRQIWVFDGSWLIEKRPDEKLFVAREIAPANADFDPLRIGEGPMPIPIGQRARDVLARYDAELRAPDELFEPDAREALFVADTWRLVLTPKADNIDDEEFREINVWYRKDTLLPRMAKTVNRRGDESYVQLINVRVNEPLPEGVIDTSPPPREEDWDVRIERREARN